MSVNYLYNMYFILAFLELIASDLISGVSNTRIYRIWSIGRFASLKPHTPIYIDKLTTFNPV